MAIFKSKVATKDGRKWFYSVCYLTANGERKRKKGQLYATKQEAREAERQFLLEIIQDRVDITFEEMYHKYIVCIKENVKGSTIYTKNCRVKTHILKYFGKMKIHEIDIPSIYNWKDLMNRKSKNNGKQPEPYVCLQNYAERKKSARYNFIMYSL